MAAVFFFFCSTDGWRSVSVMRERWNAPTVGPTREAVRSCSWASGRRNERSCWTGSSSPPQTLAAGRRGSLTGAGRTGEAARPRGRAAGTKTTFDLASFLHQKGRKRIQRRETCSHTHSQRSTGWRLVTHSDRCQHTQSCSLFYHLNP